MLRRIVVRFLRDEKGATAIEYGLIAGLVAITIIAALTTFGNSMVGLFGYVEDTAGGAMAAAASSGG